VIQTSHWLITRPFDPEAVKTRKQSLTTKMQEVIEQHKAEYKTTARGESGSKGRAAQLAADNLESQTLEIDVELERMAEDIAGTISELGGAVETQSVWTAIDNSAVLDKKTVESMDNVNLARLAAVIHRIKHTLYRYRGLAFSKETAQDLLQLVHDTVLLGHASPIPGTAALYFQAHMQNLWDRDTLGDADTRTTQDVWHQLRVDLHGVDVLSVLNAVYLPACIAAKTAASKAADQSSYPFINPLNLEAMLKRQHGRCFCAPGCGRKLLWDPEQRHHDIGKTAERYRYVGLQHYYSRSSIAGLELPQFSSHNCLVDDLSRSHHPWVVDWISGSKAFLVHKAERHAAEKSTMLLSRFVEEDLS